MTRHTKLCSLVVVLGLLVGALTLTADARRGDKDYSLRVVGLSITLPDEGDDDLVPTINDGLSVYFAAKLPDKNIIGVDEDNYTLKAFKDDKGTTLLSTDIDDHEFTEGLDVDTFFNENPELILFSFRSSKLPDAEATKLIIEATIPVLCGDSVETKTSSRPIQAGDEITMGDYSFTVDSVDAEDGSTSVSLTSSTGFAPLKAITFVDADGDELDSDSWGTSSMTMMGVTTYSQSYQVAAAPGKVHIQVEYYEDMETVEMDLDVEVSVGLQIND